MLSFLLSGEVSLNYTVRILTALRYAAPVHIDETRCNKWMPVAKSYCKRLPGHTGKCARMETLQRNVARHRDRKARRRAAIAAYKIEQGCVDCGYRANHVALDLDHTDPTGKIQNVSEMYSLSWETVLAELAKCVVRCANCHRIKTHAKTTTALNSQG